MEEEWPLNKYCRTIGDLYAIICKKISTDRFYSFLTKLLKMGHRCKCKMKTIKLLRESVGENLCDLGCGKEFLNKYDP